MALFHHVPDASKSLRVLAHLLAYPDAGLRGHLADLRAALHAERALPAARLAELDALIDVLGRKAQLEVEADYVELFDRGRATSLHLFEHVHGDSRDRGPAMIDLTKTYEQEGLFLGEGELPDFVPVVLEFASTLAPRQARDFLAEMAHIFNAIFAALQQRESPYAAVLGALLELAGEKASPVEIAPEESIDAVWEEPVVFDGCSSKGQSRPDQVQPIHIVPKSAREALKSLGAQQ
ncbi:MAG: nitrate reductase molybdenum cofactor assembly chaperone [Burkholderiaceae bacterium]|jgi:nitrate reductase delta subunit|nr:nitrate reductase molybdenum cofactor assembly chaperone [Burkholderiaceae bacterium]MCO5104157.1 nitrate reductase molybdenum cofactor assembly chaperone [Burkholderiaceae bacterium]